MYRFFDKKSNEIIEKYKITEYILIFENNDFIQYKEGLNELSNHTCSILFELSQLDDLGTFLLNESIRYLLCVYHHQKFPNRLHEDYYKKILDKFHELGYLNFKQTVIPYKLYKNKKYIFKIKYNDNIMTYYSLKNMIVDFGRYRVERITKLFKKNSELDYNFIQCGMYDSLNLSSKY